MGHAATAGAYVDADRVIDLAVRLARQPSQQTDLFERDPAVIDLIRGPVLAELQAIPGLEIAFDGMENLLARLPGPAEGRPLLLVAYAMTPQAGTMPDAFSGEIRDGSAYGIAGPVIWGRGLCEQKAGLTAMIEGVRAAVASGRPRQRPVNLLVSTAGETGRHDSVRTGIDALGLTGGIGIVGLGTDLEICLANKGRIDVQVAIHGRVAHSSAPWQGVSAIEGLRRVLNRVSAIDLSREHPLLGPASLTPIHVRSFPDATHTVQGRVNLTLDRRLLPGDDPDEVLGDLAAFIRDDPSLGPEFRVEVEQGPTMYPSEAPADAEIVRLLQASAAAAGHAPLPLTSSPQAMDAGYLNHVGIEAVMFSPGDVTWAHTDQEVVSVSQIVESARIFAELLTR
ncbi:MAG: M20/M25/M40 family metallo-hydrolase [Thermomicrobiales bacterium]|nr:M20/M25/M40 family metallo-hydrolase [Thermomicrobiales bacterium]